MTRVDVVRLVAEPTDPCPANSVVSLAAIAPPLGPGCASRHAGAAGRAVDTLARRPSGRAPQGRVPVEARRTGSTRGHAPRRVRRQARPPPPHWIPGVEAGRRGTELRPLMEPTRRREAPQFRAGQVRPWRN